MTAALALIGAFGSVMVFGFLTGFVFGLLKRIDRWLSYDEDVKVYIAVTELGESEHKP